MLSCTGILKEPKHHSSCKTFFRTQSFVKYNNKTKSYTLHIDDVIGLELLLLYSFGSRDADDVHGGHGLVVAVGHVVEGDMSQKR